MKSYGWGKAVDSRYIDGREVVIHGHGAHGGPEPHVSITLRQTATGKLLRLEMTPEECSYLRQLLADRMQSLMAMKAVEAP